jgi:hypothetical protein
MLQHVVVVFEAAPKTPGDVPFGHRHERLFCS